jgi:hypothetical protein
VLSIAYFWAMPHRRSLISKIFITSIYVAFLFVQLHLKYVVTNLGPRISYVSADKQEKSGFKEFIQGKNPQKLNVLINKRYYPEQPIEASYYYPVVSRQFFILPKITVPESGVTVSPLLTVVTDRGPPVHLI